MEINFTEKIALCYTVAGPTYKKNALARLKERVIHENIKYFVITDNREFFSEVVADDIIIKELKEFYEEYPEIQPYEYFYETDDLEEYGNAFLYKDYSFPFSAMRFHLKLAYDHNITNVGLLATDSTIRLQLINDELLSNKNILYNAVSLWPCYEHDMIKMDYIESIVEKLWNTKINRSIMIYDEAARFYVFRDTEFMNKFFRMWHELITEMYETRTIRHFRGTFMHNEELMVAVIYDLLNMTHPMPYISLFEVNHDLAGERPWTVGAGAWSN